MRKEERTVADRAIQSLLHEDSLELPDPRLKDRLQEEHERLGRGLRPAGSRSISRAAAVFLLVALSGVAVGATIGLDALKSWWYSITVDGEESKGTIDGDGMREMSYLSEDGYEISVRVGRRDLPGAGTETTFDVREEGDGNVEESSEVLIAPGTQERTAQEERFDRSVLESARVLHTWTDQAGLRQSLWLGSDPGGPGSRLLQETLESRDKQPVLLVLRTARPITKGGQVNIEELEGGSLAVEISDGRGWELAVILGGQVGLPAPTEFQTPSGRVRATVGD